jgi:uncharacterized repeat protein (TIGR01451 family)
LDETWVQTVGAGLDFHDKLRPFAVRLLGALLFSFCVVFLPSAANAQFLVNKSFTPANVVSGETSILTIQVLNNTTTIATALSVTDTMPTSPTGLVIAPGGLLSNTCGGTVAAVPGSNTITLTGGTVAASAAGSPGTCQFTVQVVANPATPPATYVNTIPPANVSSSIGGTAASASATLAVAAIKPITGTKSFSTTLLQGNGPVSRMSITLNQANTIALTGVAFTDSFPAQMQIAPTPNLANSCGGTVSALAAATSVSLSAGNIPAAGSCTISVDVVARNANTVPFNGAVTNTIAAGGVTSTLGATNAAAISGSITVQTGAVVTKAFSPASVVAGTNSTLTLTLSNYNASAIGAIAFSDAMPTGVTLVGATTNSCGGVSTSTATSAGMSGGGLAAAPATVGGFTSCTITVAVTSATAGTYVNAVPAGNLSGVAFNAATATLTVTPFTPVSVAKSFNVATTARGATTTLTITLTNPSTTVAAAITSFADNLNTMGTGYTIGTGATTSCGGALTATSGATLISLSGGSIPIAGTCTITVPVVVGASAAIATATNTIPVGALQTALGNSTAAATDTLVINGAGVAKAFSPNRVAQGQTSTLTITLTNADTTSVAAITAFSDNLTSMGAGFTIVSGSTTCGGTLTATPGTTLISLSGGTIPVAPSTAVSGSCTITVMVDVGPTAPIGNRTNTISAGALQTSVGNNSAAATTNLRVTNVTAAKAFSPTTTARGGTSLLTITLNNPDTGGSATITSFTDNLTSMGTGFTVAASPAPTTTCTGGTVTATVGGTVIALAGGTIPIAPSSTTPGSCTITVPVLVSTSVTAPTGVNIVAAGALVTSQGTNNATAQATLNVRSVSVSKAFSPTSTPRGANSTLTITLSNPNAATAIAITSFADNLNTMGAGFTIAPSPAIASTTCVGSTLTAVAGTTSISLAGGVIPIAPTATTFGTCTITIPVTVSVGAPLSAATNTIPIGALVSAGGGNLAAATATLTPTDALTVAKAFSVSPVPIGGVTRLTITLTKVANAPLFTSLAVADTLPGGFLISATPAATTTCAGGTVAAVAGATSVSLSGGSLGTTIGAVASCTVSVNVTAPATLGPYTNTIPIGGATATTSAGTVSNAAAASATIQVIDGLRLNKSFTPTNIPPNGTTRLKIFITNTAAGSIALTGVAMTDTLPFGLVVKSPPNATLTSTIGTCTGTISAVAGAGSVGLSGGTISAGASCELAVDVTTSAIGSMTNTLLPNTLTSTQGQSNVNTASATLVSAGSADVGISKTDGVATMIAGNATTYTIIVRNNDTLYSVAGIPVVDTPPAGMTFPTWTCTPSAGSTCSSASGTGPIAQTVSLPPLGTATFTVSGLLASSSALASITNAATISPSSAGVIDTDPTNNSASDTNAVTRSADLRIIKTASNSVAPIGGALAFTITATNLGPSDAASVSVSDVLPAGYAFVGAVPSVGTFTAPNWAVGTLASGTSATLVINTTVNASGGLTNTATGTTTTSDPVPGNNSSSVTLATINLTVTKTSLLISDPVNGTANPKMIPGAIVEYSITVSNAGTSPIDANTIVIRDPFPTMISPYVSTGAGPPVILVDGIPSSGLTLTYGTGVTWSNQAGGDVPFTYAPAPDGSGFDSSATGVRITPTGAMAATGTFTIKFKARIN